MQVNYFQNKSIKTINFLVLFSITFSIWMCLYLYISTACSVHMHDFDILGEHFNHAHSLILATVTGLSFLLSFIFLNVFLKIFNTFILREISLNISFDKSPPPKKKLIRAISNPRSPPQN